MESTNQRKTMNHEPPTMNHSGLLLCARYALSPNLLHYCGPEKQRDLSSYVHESASDRGLMEILHKFETLYPYLVLIAHANSIHDPFDRRVVDAYWLGSDLLVKVKQKDYVRHLSDTLFMKKKLTLNEHSILIDHLHDGLPHHTFHVLNIFVRTGHATLIHSLETMDNCRIGWGKVLTVTRQMAVVQTQPLIVAGTKLALGPHVSKVIDLDGQTPILGSVISFHWNRMCAVLSREEERSLKLYTARALKFANRTQAYLK